MSQQRLVALYARVSTEEQAKEGQSLATQISRLSHYALSRGFDNTRVFVDDGYSAKSMNRPALKELLSLIREGRVAAVCTMAVDRLSRNLLDMLKFVELCEQHDTSFICTALNFDTSSPIGRMTLQMLAAFAEFERAMIASRVRSNMHEIVREKRRFLSSPPFGYAFDSEGVLRIVEPEARWVRAAVDMYLGGRGYREIARWLNRSGAPRTRRGNPWSPSSVKAMLANRTYTGTVVWGRRCTDSRGRVVRKNEDEWTVAADVHAPIIGRAKWDAVMERMQSARNKGGIHRSYSRLAGLVRCGHCGCKMVSRNYGNCGPNRGRRIYVCSGYQKKGICRFNYVFADVLEDEVLKCLSLVSPDLPGPGSHSETAATDGNQGCSVPGFLSWLWHEADIRLLHRFLELVLECCVVADRRLEEVRMSSRLISPMHSQDCL